MADLTAAGLEIEERYGLSSVEGGHHPAWGTANRIVPLGDSYLELISVVDESKAGESPFGRWVASSASSSFRPLGWAVRTTRLDQIAGRLGLSVHAGSRATPGGDEVRWRSAGVDGAAAEPSLPFFIQWGPKTQLPGRAEIHHAAGAARIARLDLSADAGWLRGWLGEHDLPIVVSPGKPAVTAIHIAVDQGQIVLS